MEASIVAAALLNPVALLLLALFLSTAAYLGAQSGVRARRISWRRLVGGFAGVFVASLLVPAAGTYVSPGDAARFGVSPEYYASVLWREFVVLAVLSAYISLVGCAVIGLPATVALAKRGYGTAPAVIAASLPISLLVLVPLGSISSFSPEHLAESALYLVPAHLAAASGFALGARLPWRIRQQIENDA